MDCVCDKFSRMCIAHRTTTKKSDIKSCMLVDSSHFFVHAKYVGVFLFLYLFSSFSTYCHEMLIRHTLKKFEFCVRVQLWEIIHVPCMKSSISTTCCTLCVIS